MTSNLTHLVERVRELVASGTERDERVDALILHGPLPSAEAQTAWIAFVDDVPAPFTTLQVYNPALGGDLVAGDAFDPNREVLITLGKPAFDGHAVFIFESAVAPYLAQKTVSPRLAVADLSPERAFRTRGLEVVHWDLAQPVTALVPPPSPTD